MDPETASISSEAPSYFTAAAAPPPPQYSQAIVPPPTYYADASSPRYSSLLSNPSAPDVSRRPNRLPHTKDIISPGMRSYLTDISPARSSMQSPMYQRVATRRANKASKASSLDAPGFGRAASFDSAADRDKAPVLRRRGLSEPQAATLHHVGEEDEEQLPEEDVEEGEEAEEAVVDDMEEALAQESKEWDFMLSQMKDWDDREKRWNRFKENRLQTGWKGFTKGLRQG